METASSGRWGGGPPPSANSPFRSFCSLFIGRQPLGLAAFSLLRGQRLLQHEFHSASRFSGWQSGTSLPIEAGAPDGAVLLLLVIPLGLVFDPVVDLRVISNSHQLYEDVFAAIVWADVAKPKALKENPQSSRWHCG